MYTPRRPDFGQDGYKFRHPPALREEDINPELLKKLKNYFQTMDSQIFHRAIGMVTAKIVKVDIEHQAGILAYDNQLYPCVFSNKKIMKKFAELEGTDAMISFWPTQYKKIILQNGEKKKILVLQIKGLRPEIQENGYIEVRGIVSEIEPKENKFKVSIKEQKTQNVHKVRIFGKYTGNIGDFIVAECALAKGDIQFKSSVLLATNQFVPFAKKFFKGKPPFNKNRSYDNRERSYDNTRTYEKKYPDRTN